MATFGDIFFVVKIDRSDATGFYWAMAQDAANKHPIMHQTVTHNKYPAHSKCPLVNVHSAKTEKLWSRMTRHLADRRSLEVQEAIILRKKLQRKQTQPILFFFFFNYVE